MSKKILYIWLTISVEGSDMSDIHLPAGRGSNWDHRYCCDSHFVNSRFRQLYIYFCELNKSGLCLSVSDMKGVLCLIAAGLYLCLQIHVDAGKYHL